MLQSASGSASEVPHMEPTGREVGYPYPHGEYYKNKLEMGYWGRGERREVGYPYPHGEYYKNKLEMGY